MKFRLEKIGGRIIFGLWKIKSRMCLCNQGYTRSAWRGGGKNTQHQPGEAVAIILASWHVKRFCQGGAVWVLMVFSLYHAKGQVILADSEQHTGIGWH